MPREMIALRGIGQHIFRFRNQMGFGVKVR